MSDDRKKILWVIPVFQSVYPKAFGQFLAMAFGVLEEREKYSVSIHVPERTLLHGAMNNAAAVLLQHDFDLMIVSDDDCIPPTDAIPRLLRHYEDGLDIVGGVGFTRGFPHTTTVGRYFPSGITLDLEPATGSPRLAGFEWIEDLAGEPDDLVKADFCGFPIAMISRRAFEKIEAPWFGTWLDGGGCTHDVYFGTKAKRAGLQIFVDRTIPCGHIAEAPVVTFENREMARGMARVMTEARERARGEQKA